MLTREGLPQFITENTVHPCPAETQDLAYVSSKSANAIISSGLNPAAAGSAALALQIANRLNSRLPNSSTSEAASPVRVTRRRSS